MGAFVAGFIGFGMQISQGHDTTSHAFVAADWLVVASILGDDFRRGVRNNRAVKKYSQYFSPESPSVHRKADKTWNHKDYKKSQLRTLTSSGTLILAGVAGIESANLSHSPLEAMTVGATALFTATYAIKKDEQLQNENTEILSGRLADIDQMRFGLAD